MTSKNGHHESSPSAVAPQNGSQHASEKPVVPRYIELKRPFVRVMSLVVFLAILPVLLVLYAIVVFTSRGPGLYKQKRLGRHGKEFKIIKFRTMYHNAEELSGPVWSSRNDTRITPVGKFYRLLHLDELPQLYNVVRGEMCLIGPRPERPEIIKRDRLHEHVEQYDLRSLVLPGITGLAQINLPPDETIACVQRKVALDLEYIRTASLGLDVRIILCTVLRMFGIRHGRAVGFFKLGRQVDMSQFPRSASHVSAGQREEELSHPADYLTNDKPLPSGSARRFASNGAAVAELEAVELESAEDEDALDDVSDALPRRPR